MTPVDPAARNVAETLFGRDDDIGIVRSFLDSAASHGAALLLSGEAGVGKSAMLDVTEKIAAAAGTRVLRAAGVQFTAEVSFSGLDQLLSPVRSEFGRLSIADHAALSVALGLGGGPAPSRFAVSNATLALLNQIAGDRPTLAIVDDVQWLDRASSDLLALVARRLAGSRIGLIAASRTGSGGAFEEAGLPGRDVRPLDNASASRLIGTLFPTLAGRVHQRMLAEAEGNPLAIVELPASLSSAQRVGREALPPVLPLNERLRAVFASSLDDLPAATRELLLIAALQGSGDLRVLQAATRVSGGLASLAPAEQARLVFIHQNRRQLAFRHPLVRSTVVETSALIERRRAHRALAEALDDEPERRAWHMAEATIDPDEQVATLLERAARGSLKRGDAVAAVAALTRAAELSPLRADRGRRLVEAAYIGAEVTGDMTNAALLLTDARREELPPAGALQAAIAASYLLLNAECDIDSAHRLLVGAILAYGDHYDAEDETLLDALHSLLMICWFGGRPELWAPFNDAVDRISPQPPELLSVCAATFGDPVHQAGSARESLSAVLATLGEEFNPVQITRIGVATVYVDRLDECRAALGRVIRDGRDGGAVALAINALVSSCVDGWLTGQWDEALSLAAEGVEISETHGYRRYSVILGGYIQALIRVARGDVETGLAAADEMAKWAGLRGVGMAAAFVHHVRALAAIGLGDFEAAYRHASAISPAGVLARYTPHALWVLMDLVEAALHTGRSGEARAHVAAMLEADIAALSPRLALVSGGCAAMVAADGKAVPLYEAALATPGAERWPFDLARVQLSFGVHLHRAKAVTESRVHLKSAIEIFESLGAQPWVSRAASELRATGLPGWRPAVSGATALTPQELEIAMLAASGLSNKQIAKQLYLSPRTVGARLYQIFPRLGITTRAALRDALDAGRRTPD
jgi:DNA-binding CsgD family transcriptional regulator